MTTPTPDPARPHSEAPGIPPKPPWYRRRMVLAVAVIAVLLVITVITDIPEHSSLKDQAKTERAVLKAVDVDIHPCTFSIQQAFTLYSDGRNPTVPASTRVRIPRLMATDAAACSFSNSTVLGLSTITEPGSTAGHDMGDAVSTVTLWVTSDALAAIDQLELLNSNPHDAKARADLDKEERLLASDRAKADADVAAVNRQLHSHLPAPALPRLPDPG